ncbi:uncharacterized protein LOC134723056 [Mytilus trossulus]|uniref:uncharacterized protein LOC134723056 n=1 Tax=Mytilus trossulus TaxID=6551 RepID=UPI003005F5FD
MARCIFENYVGEEFETKIGLPQGSVLAPTLLNIFINDLLGDILGDYTNFADDGTLWQTAQPDQILELKDRMKDDITKAVKWTKKWRVNINLDKTEICIFSKKKTSMKRTNAF